MERRGAVLAIAGAIALALGVGGALTGAPTTPRQSSDLASGGYRPVPTPWLVNDEIRFSPLGERGTSRVRVGVVAAIRSAERGYARAQRTRVVFESLGGYVDDNQIVHDWVGTRSWVPLARPAYFVRLAGVYLPSLGPGGAVNHHVDVIVSATTGAVICATSYN